MAEFSHFNPRSRTGSDVGDPSTVSLVYISIHAPERGATREPVYCAAKIRISIHAPERGATSDIEPDILEINISIHAPERGATFLLIGNPSSERISIHAPERGATEGRVYPLDYKGFQSTLPNGERQIIHVNFPLQSISIHAPERGATTRLKVLEDYKEISIHAPERGATVSNDCPSAIFPHFNPRSRTGSDNGSIPHAETGVHFNPRSRTGSDTNREVGVEPKIEISIHAPERGAT